MHDEVTDARHRRRHHAARPGGGLRAVADPDPRAAWVAHYTTHRRALVAEAGRILGDHGDDAEDVVHDVIRRVLRRPPSLDDPAAGPGYLRAAVRNVAVSRVTRRREDATLDAPSDPGSGPGAERLADPAPPVEDVVVFPLVVGPALAGLSARQREVIVLVDLGRLRIGEAAGALGISVGAAKKHRFVGLRRLRHDPGITALRGAA